MIFIVGPHNAGKSSIAKHLRDRGFVHIETGDIVRQKHKESATDLDLHTWAREHQHRFDHFIAETVSKAHEEVISSEGKLHDIVITGNRQPEGIEYLLNHVASLEGKTNLIIWVEANEEVLFRRHQERPDRNIPKLTFEEFQTKILDFDREMGLERIKEKAHLVVRNEGQLRECLHCITEFLGVNGYQLETDEVEGSFSRNSEIR